MRLIVIRHGESEADVLKVCEGRADYNLTNKGHQQAENMSRVISEEYKIDKIYTSSLKRAIQTAEHLAEKCNLPLIKEDKLKEFNNGLRAGLPFDEAYSKYPSVQVPIYSSNYDQESELNFRMRAEYILSKIISENSQDATIAIVSHGGMIMRLYQAFLKLPIDSNIKFTTGDACYHEWEIKDKQRYINCANRNPLNLVDRF